MNGSWGFNIKDQAFKSTEDLLHLVIKAAGKNSNTLLNTGPMPNGKIQPENVITLKEMGVWMKKYGETIYATRGGPVEGDWGTTTAKGNKLFIHMLDASISHVEIPLQGRKVSKLSLFDTGEKIKFKKLDDAIKIPVPAHEKMIDYILVLELK